MDLEELQGKYNELMNENSRLKNEKKELEENKMKSSIWWLGKRQITMKK